MTEVTELLRAARTGQQADINRLFELLYDELRSLARQQSWKQVGAGGHTTTLVHEAYVRFKASDSLSLADRAHFLAYASHVMRSIVVDHARSRLAQKRGAGLEPVSLDTGIIESATATDEQVVQVHEALQALTSLDERLGKIVEMEYFGGMTETEIAEVLDVSARTVQRGWEKARMFLSASFRTD